ncbi:MAG TPA: redoxin domain-containing protein, partial [Fimbriimonadaceae bacterium]|nr:redoxin domain-containing protein [Fimbriimonadaceae bacterium]
WKEKEGIPAVLLSDYSHKVIHEYDVAFPNFAGTGGESAARAVYVIAKGGEIKYSAQTASPGELPDFDAVRAALD